MSAIVKSLEMQIDVNLFGKTCEITLYGNYQITFWFSQPATKPNISVRMGETSVYN